MRFWVYDSTKKGPVGPFETDQLQALPGFGSETFIAMEGSTGAEAWKPAKSIPELAGVLKSVPLPPPPFPPGGIAPSTMACEKKGGWLKILIALVVLTVAGFFGIPMYFMGYWAPRMSFRWGWNQTDLGKAWWLGRSKLHERDRRAADVREGHITMMISGKLPIGTLQVRAISISDSDGHREPAVIMPETMETQDPVADLHALAINAISSQQGWNDAAQRCADSGTPGCLIRGRYYVFVEKDGHEVVGSKLDIEP